MKRSNLLVAIVGSGLLMGAAMMSAPKVTANPSLLYLAGQAKMALGDTTSGLQLISRAARQQQVEQTPVPQAIPARAQTAAAKPCTQRSARQVQPTVVAKAGSEKKNVARVAVNSNEPKMIMAKLSFPSAPFANAEALQSMSPEQIERVTAQYKEQVARWARAQNEQQQEMAQLQHMALRTPEVFKARHNRVVRMMLPPTPPEHGEFSPMTPEPPRTNP